MPRTFNEIELQAGRTEDLEGELENLAGEPLALVAGDKLHFTLASARGGPAALQLESGTVTGNGSTIEITDLGGVGDPATYRIRLAEADTSAFAGRYFAALDLEDDSETAPANAIKPVTRGLILFQANVDLTP